MRKWVWAARCDGLPVKDKDPFYRIMPHIMTSRSDAQVHYHDEIDITRTLAHLRARRADSEARIRLIDVLMAACVRVYAEKPKLNRFVKLGRHYAHKRMEVCMAVKKTLTNESTDTIQKMQFDLTETLSTLAGKVSAAIDFGQTEGAANGTDRLAAFLNACPVTLMGILVHALKALDAINLLPATVIHASPFHNSLFITDVGSIGIGSVYHHIYNFGTTSVFVSMGRLMTRPVLTREGHVENRTFMDLRIVVDERICDGFYFAGAFKRIRWFIQHPEALEVPPERVMTEI